MMAGNPFTEFGTLWIFSMGFYTRIIEQKVTAIKKFFCVYI